MQGRIILLFLLSVSPLLGQTVFTYRVPESESDKRYEYDKALLELALKKTVTTHGPYELVPSPPMNFDRAHKELLRGTFENPMFKTSATN